MSSAICCLRGDLLLLLQEKVVEPFSLPSAPPPVSKPHFVFRVAFYRIKTAKVRRFVTPQGWG